MASETMYMRLNAVGHCRSTVGLYFKLSFGGYEFWIFLGNSFGNKKQPEVAPSINGEYLAWHHGMISPRDMKDIRQDLSRHVDVQHANAKEDRVSTRKCLP